MEKTYRILKIVLAVLIVVAVLLGINLMNQKAKVQKPEAIQSGPQAEQPLEENAGEAAEAITEAIENAAPDFTCYDLEGNAHSLSDYRGKPVVLNFWASWCGPCKAEMPDFEEAYAEYGEQIQFLVVNLTDGVQETVTSASDYIAGQGYTFPVFYDVNLAGAEAYRVYAIPVTYFIDSQGSIRASNEGMISPDVLQQNIEALLALQ